MGAVVGDGDGFAQVGLARLGSLLAFRVFDGVEMVMVMVLLVVRAACRSIYLEQMGSINGSAQVHDFYLASHMRCGV